MLIDDLKSKIIFHKNLVFYGDVHISKESSRIIKNLSDKESPDCIAIELDKERLEKMMKKSTIERMLIKVSRKYKEFDKAYGGAFKEAIELSEKKKIPLVLIDKKFNQPNPSFFEVITGIIRLKREDISLEEFSKQNQDKLNELTRERDLYMAQRLKDIEKKYNKILVVVGYAHIKPIIKILQSM